MTDRRPSDPLAIAAQLRAYLERIDAIAVRRTLLLYGDARERIIAAIATTLERIGESGVTLPSESLALIRQTELLTLIETELLAAGARIEPVLTEARRLAVNAAIDAGLAMAAAQGTTLTEAAELVRQWTRLDREAVDHLTRTLGDGSPLREVLDRMAVQTREAVTEAIERAVVEHVNVGDLAAQLARTTELTERRALMVTREATFSAQRAAADASYRENAHLLRGKMRHERMDGKTCRACAALHGKVYGVDEVMPHHVNCRRVEIPITSNGRGIQSVQSGEDWLREQPEAEQLQVFGGNRTAHQAWASGEVTLEDFVAVDQTKWGPQSRVVSVDRARSNAERRRGANRAAAD